jgi:allophanate hydrolase
VLAAVAATREANPAWIYVMPQEALLRRAAALEARRAEGERLPLYGVPFAIKDNIDAGGHPTTAACPDYAYVARETAHAVERLERAGAILVGKTNMDQFATGLVGTRSPYGACVNPFDARYICGGSSSGSAVAVALGQVSFALGTDTAGSGRVPAGFCNIVGLKPTRGLVSAHGVVPACRSLDCVSIFALTAEDAAAVFDIARGYDAADPHSRESSASTSFPRRRESRTYKAEHLRLGVPCATHLKFFGDAAAERAFEHALNSLRTLRVELVEFDYSPFADVARLLYEGSWVAERLAAIKPFFEASSERMHPVVRDIIAKGANYSAVDAFESEYELRRLHQRCVETWKAVDMLVVPTAGTIYRIEEVLADPVALNTNLGYYTNFVNLLDLAAIAVPAGFREDGLPCGITLISPAFGEAALAQWGARFHRATSQRLGATSFALS